MKELKKVWVWDNEGTEKMEMYLLVSSDKDNSCLVIAPYHYTNEYLRGNAMVPTLAFYNWEEIPKVPKLGALCKFWDGKEEPKIKNAYISCFSNIKPDFTYNYVATTGIAWEHCKQLKGFLEEEEWYPLSCLIVNI